MSRPIKFRAWDKLAKVMRSTPLLLTEFAANNEDFEVMQYTGLKDKNDTDIYEGDIVQHRNKQHPPFYIVEWLDETAAFRIRATNQISGCTMFVNSKGQCPYTVIGNIYENPELLKQ